MNSFLTTIVIICTLATIISGCGGIHTAKIQLPEHKNINKNIVIIDNRPQDSKYIHFHKELMYTAYLGDKNIQPDRFVMLRRALSELIPGARTVSVQIDEFSIMNNTSKMDNKHPGAPFAGISYSLAIVLDEVLKENGSDYFLCSIEGRVNNSKFKTEHTVSYIADDYDSPEYIDAAKLCISRSSEKAADVIYELLSSEQG